MDLKAWQIQFFKQVMPNQQSETSEQGMSIYSQSILGNQLSSLKSTYPALLNLIGEESFELITTSYLQQQNNYAADIGELGLKLPEYLQTHAICDMLPYIAELADFEWAWSLAFNNESIQIDQGLNEQLTIQEARIILRATPLLHLRAYDYEIDQIWQSCQQDFKGDFKQINTDESPTHLLIYREGLSIITRRIDKPTYSLIQYFNGNRTLEDIHKNFSKDYPDSPFEEIFPTLCKWNILTTTLEYK